MKKNLLLVITIVIALLFSVALVRLIDAHRLNTATQLADESLYVNAATAKRMTLAFKRLGTDWKVVHLHTSPDAPPATRVLPSEQTATPAATPSATPPRP